MLCRPCVYILYTMLHVLNIKKYVPDYLQPQQPLLSCYHLFEEFLRRAKTQGPHYETVMSSAMLNEYSTAQMIVVYILVVNIS